MENLAIKFASLRSPISVWSQLTAIGPERVVLQRATAQLVPEAGNELSDGYRNTLDVNLSVLLQTAKTPNPRMQAHMAHESPHPMKDSRTKSVGRQNTPPVP